VLGQHGLVYIQDLVKAKNNMALGALTLGNDNVGLDAAGSAMVPVSSGDK